MPCRSWMIYHFSSRTYNFPVSMYHIFFMRKKSRKGKKTFTVFARELFDTFSEYDIGGAVHIVNSLHFNEWNKNRDENYDICYSFWVFVFSSVLLQTNQFAECFIVIFNKQNEFLWVLEQSNRENYISLTIQTRTAHPRSFLP